MTVVQKHFDRCRLDRPVLYATVGIGFYGTLTLAVLVYSALEAVWS